MIHEKPQRVVVCAANRNGATIVCGARHFDGVMHGVIRGLKSAPSPGGWAQGFIDQWGIFMDRREALVVATAAGQINVRRPKTNPVDQLFSEDLY